jgi:homoserine dehydrogenase
MPILWRSNGRFGGEVMERARIGLLGYGTVGSNVYRLLERERVQILEATGVDLEVVAIAERDTSKHGVAAPKQLFVTDAEAVISRPDIDIIVELVGGVEAAFGFVHAALSAGKSVVTANKQLLANRGAPLFELAKATERQIRFEASVAGAVPIIKVMRESMIAADLHTVYGIVNGTTNYILTAMHNGEGDYEATLSQAQRLGYAEADPTDDVSGGDAAAKMAILASIAFKSRVTLADVQYEGIERITPADVQYAKEFGFIIKLVGAARLIDGRVNVHVSPALVPEGHPLAAISGSYNAVLLQGHVIDEIMLSGPGAGGLQTSSAVISDIVSIVSTKTAGFLQNCSCYRHLDFYPDDDLESAFFVRAQVEDRAGVLAQISSVFAEHEVSIQSMIQKGHGEEPELVFVTHPTKEHDLNAALIAVEALACVRGDAMAIRVL